MSNEPYVAITEYSPKWFRVNVREYQSWRKDWVTTKTAITRSERVANRVGKRMLKKAKERSGWGPKSWEIR